MAIAVVPTPGRRRAARFSRPSFGTPREHQAGDVLLPLLRTRAELGLLLCARRERASRDRGAAMLADTRRRADALGLVQIGGLVDAAGS